MLLRCAALTLAALSLANMFCTDARAAFEFDKTCLEHHDKLIEAMGTSEEIAEETETDPILMTKILTDKSYQCSSADKSYLKRQVEKDGKIILFSTNSS